MNPILDGGAGFARASATKTVAPGHAVESVRPMPNGHGKKGDLGGNMVSPELDGLGVLAGLEPARARVREEAAA